ncbi:hypothetical protein ABN260_19875, partial [Escherichia coli]
SLSHLFCVVVRISPFIRWPNLVCHYTSPYQQVAREVKAPRERLKYALEAGLLVTALDGLFWFGSQRIAADVLRLRKAGMPVVTTTVEVHDNLTGTTRKVPAYHL